MPETGASRRLSERGSDGRQSRAMQNDGERLEPSADALAGDHGTRETSAPLEAEKQR